MQDPYNEQFLPWSGINTNYKWTIKIYIIYIIFPSATTPKMQNIQRTQLKREIKMKLFLNIQLTPREIKKTDETNRKQLSTL